MLKDAAAEDAALQAGCEVPQALRPWLGFAAGCVTQFNVSSFPLPAKASEGCLGGTWGLGWCPGVAGLWDAAVGGITVLPSAGALPDAEMSSQNGDSNSK